jgi:DNA-binding MarR family transcriptional regulator
VSADPPPVPATERAVEDALRAHSAGRSPGFLLWHTTLRWQREVAAALREVSLTHVQFLLLASTWWLGREGRRPNQRQVADHAGLDQVMTSQVVRTLERHELLGRVRSATDSRAWELELTDAGRQLAERAVLLMDAVDARFFTVGRDLDALVEDLRLLAARTPTGDAVEDDS